MAKARDRHFEEFSDHTLLKHAILRAYLQSWAMKLLSDPNRKIWFVDGFAGEGQDQSGNQGSPLIAAEIARDILKQKGPRGGDAPMRVIAIEENESRFEKLRGLLGPYTHMDPTVAYAAHGTLSDHIGTIAPGIGESPALYFLDPYGIKGLRHEHYEKALSGPRNELFVLFSDTGAHRLYSTLLSSGRDLDLELAELRQKPGLFPSMDREDEQRTVEEVERSNRSLERTRRAARRYLADALGEDIDELVTGDDAQRQAEDLTRLFMARLREAGAEYVLRFPMRNEQNNQVYQLVYATKSAAGLRAMKEAMHRGLNSGRLPSVAADAIRDDLRLEVGDLVDMIRSRFAGEEVRWTENHDRGTADTVKRFLLEETPAFPWQFEEVKVALEEAGYRQDGRVIQYRF